MYESKIGDVCEVVEQNDPELTHQVGDFVEVLEDDSNIVNCKNLSGRVGSDDPMYDGELSYICHIDDWPTHPRNPAAKRLVDVPIYPNPKFHNGGILAPDSNGSVNIVLNPEEIFERAFNQMYKNQKEEITMEKITIATRVEIEQEYKTLPPTFKYENIEEAMLANIIAKHGGDRKSALKRHRAEYAERNKVAIKDLENVRLYSSGVMGDVTVEV